jgi:glycerol-3-phosphate acyltransferase PlsY
VLFVLIVAITRLVSLGSILAAASIPFFALWLIPVHSTVLLIGLSVISLASILKHHANIVRLAQGKEPRFGRNNKTAGLPEKPAPQTTDKPNPRKVNA